MADIIPWIVIIIVGGFLVWRMVTAKSRAQRRIFERMSLQELENLDIEKVKKQGLEKIYQEVLAQKQNEAQ